MREGGMATRKADKHQPREKTTIVLPPDLKLAAKKHALDTKQDLSDLIAEGLRLVLGRRGGR
jgi:hypothetical protein